MRLLDLFCGAGGAAMGYSRAGFEVVGVDIEPQPNYPFEFYQMDALLALEWVVEGQEGTSLGRITFDAIHASPPCQAYTTMNNRHGSGSPALILRTLELLQQIGKPWVLENVPGALRWMLCPTELTGEMFGLGVHRPRLFDASFLLMAPKRPPRQIEPAAVYGKQDGRRLWTRTDGSELRVATLERAENAMGIDWMTWDELREAIPPAYCEHIGRQLMEFL